MSRTTRQFFTVYMAIMAMSVMLLGGCDMKKKGNDVAYVDLAAVLSMSGLAQQEKERMDLVIGALKKAETEAGKLYEKMGKEQREKARQADQVMLRNLLTEAGQSARNSILSEARKAVDKVREQDGLRIVMDGSLILSSADDTNITVQVTEALKDVKADFGPLPSISVTTPKSETATAGKESEDAKSPKNNISK
ncbi:OmpH family outer membrane protein [Enterobacter cloacae subsp. cloacae]|uniref:OmpH family outer membrane protein n=1 Tax=Enterobacter cloacae TaxID=550 RepID=UPI0018C1D973|nr:OmpH family outer membrane protein [Enterobacter cloacae]MBG0524635.1 OmpH family outer membrane protein [Enterobacter cloacae]MBW4201002.1 OmpH family outer membrane protein [Enterobacter cloacae subsp. cloacae]